MHCIHVQVKASLIKQNMANLSCIYSGYISHSRHIVSQSSKSANTFKYPVMYLYLDLDEINSTFKKIAFVSINGYNIISWFRNHYIGHDDSCLADCIKDLVHLHCNKRPDKKGKVCLLTLPTQFGYGFNPVSLFYCFNQQNTKIQAVLCEGHNTPWLDTHCYVLPFFECDPDENNDLVSAQWPKAFHVSPFYTMDYQYVWSFNNPNNKQNAFKSFGCLLKHKHKMETNVSVKQHRWGTSSLANPIELRKNGIDHDKYIRAFDFGFKDIERLEINTKNMLFFYAEFPNDVWYDSIVDSLASGESLLEGNYSQTTPSK
eukprot:425344_1